MDQGADKLCMRVQAHAVLSGPGGCSALQGLRRLEGAGGDVTPFRSPQAAQAGEQDQGAFRLPGLLGRAIESIHMETSVSTLFN